MSNINRKHLSVSYISISYLPMPQLSRKKRCNEFKKKKNTGLGLYFSSPPFCLHLILNHGWIGPKIYRSHGWGRNRICISRATVLGTWASHWNYLKLLFFCQNEILCSHSIWPKPNVSIHIFPKISNVQGFLPFRNSLTMEFANTDMLLHFVVSTPEKRSRMCKYA